MSLPRCARCNDYRPPDQLGPSGVCEACRERCRAERRCCIPGCDQRHEARGYCPSHYGYWWKRPDARRRRPSSDTADEARFLASCGWRLPGIAARLYPDAHDPADSLYHALTRADEDDLWRQLRKAA